MNSARISYFLLRAGLAFSFLYAAVRGYLNPADWVGWFPPFLQDFASPDILITSWGIVEIILGLWILSGKKIFFPTLIGSLSLFGLVFFNLGAMDIVFRDVSLALISLSLAIASYRK